VRLSLNHLFTACALKRSLEFDGPMQMALTHAYVAFGSGDDRDA